jgi:hypothetical protein
MLKCHTIETYGEMDSKLHTCSVLALDGVWVAILMFWLLYPQIKESLVPAVYETG